MLDYGKFDKIASEVHEERRRQELLFKAGKHTKTIDMCSNLERLVILAEEFGEVAHEVGDSMQPCGFDKAHLREELIQVAAVCMAWVESLDREEVKIFEWCVSCRTREQELGGRCCQCHKDYLQSFP